ncbi:signal peptidase I [Kitasatospora sp. NBC_01266]|uniref:signal peptidase I n=1 Tax=Kitasatospora sp. NBC_01266 TaxID=2903572 RepID=UPI002E32E645|nr:signal peptidase I [Kitasatospora sp. NBC_01266]
MGDLVIGARGAGEPEGSGGRTAQSTESGQPSEPTDGHGGHGEGGLPEGGAGEQPAADQPQLPDVPEDVQEKPGGERKQRSFWKELPILIGIALVLALVIKTFFVQAFSIPSASMEQTLKIGDRVLVDKLTPWFGAKPDRGDVVVFHDPGGWLGDGETAQQSSNPVVRGIQDALSFIGLMPAANEKDLIKRVIGVAGDTVECQGNGPLTVNGVALNEPYVYTPGMTPPNPCGGTPFGPVKVPPNAIWVMGDHRNDSLDSRFHQDQPPTKTEPGGGFVSVNDVVGRAFVVAWPVNNWATLPVPSTFNQKGISAEGLVPPALGVVGTMPVALWLRRKRRN